MLKLNTLLKKRVCLFDISLIDWSWPRLVIIDLFWDPLIHILSFQMSGYTAYILVVILYSSTCKNALASYNLTFNNYDFYLGQIVS